MIKTVAHVGHSFFSGSGVGLGVGLGVGFVVGSGIGTGVGTGLTNLTFDLVLYWTTSPVFLSTTNKSA